MTIRVARPEDAPAIAAVEDAAAAHPWSAGQIAASLALATTRGWVAEERDAVIGHLLASASADVGEVLIVATHPDHRRRGTARALIAHAERWWFAVGVTAAFLEVRADNAPALALYTASGWRAAGRRRAYYRDGTDALVLAWSPPEPG